MARKNHIVGIRFSEDEIDVMNKRIEKEHLGYLSTLIRKATFWYIDYMERRETQLEEQEKEELLNDKQRIDS